MNMIGKFATSLIAVTAFSAIIFASASADSLKPAQSATVIAAVAGEKLDGGLGDLPSGYTAAEFQHALYRAAGQEQNSGPLNSKETPQEQLNDLQYN